MWRKTFILGMAFLFIPFDGLHAASIQPPARTVPHEVSISALAVRPLSIEPRPSSTFRLVRASLILFIALGGVPIGRAQETPLMANPMAIFEKMAGPTRQAILQYAALLEKSSAAPRRHRAAYVRDMADHFEIMVDPTFPQPLGVAVDFGAQGRPERDAKSQRVRFSLRFNPTYIYDMTAAMENPRWSRSARLSFNAVLVKEAEGLIFLEKYPEVHQSLIILRDGIDNDLRLNGWPSFEMMKDPVRKKLFQRATAVYTRLETSGYIGMVDDLLRISANTAALEEFARALPNPVSANVARSQASFIRQAAKTPAQLREWTLAIQHILMIMHQGRQADITGQFPIYNAAYLIEINEGRARYPNVKLLEDGKGNIDPRVMAYLRDPAFSMVKPSELTSTKSTAPFFENTGRNIFLPAVLILSIAGVIAWLRLKKKNTPPNEIHRKPPQSAGHPTQKLGGRHAGHVTLPLQTLILGLSSALGAFYSERGWTPFSRPPTAEQRVLLTSL